MKIDKFQFKNFNELCPDCVKHERKRKILNLGKSIQLDEKIKKMREKVTVPVLKSTLTDVSQKFEKFGQAVMKGVKTSIESMDKKKKEILQEKRENKAMKEQKQKEKELHDMYRDMGEQ